MARALDTRYRNFGMPVLLSAFAGGIALLAVFAMQGKMPSTNQTAAPAANEIDRRQVTVQLGRPADGCRWVPSTSKEDMLLIQCGDRYDMELIVFGKDKTTSYRVTVGNAPQTANPQTNPSVTQTSSTSSLGPSTPPAIGTSSTSSRSPQAGTP